MRPLVAVRRAAAFDPDFTSRDPLLWPLAPAAAALGPLVDFPPVSALDRLFAGEPPVRFVPAAPRRRRRAPIDEGTLYDARITVDREVPTRSRCWHDLMNALVWGTFPQAKQALHARQHAAIRARIAPGAQTLPPTRSPELDALALIDEGGLVVLADDPDAIRASLKSDRTAFRSALTAGTAYALVFGHAIYESLVLGVRPAVVAAVALALEPGTSSLVRTADRQLAQWLPLAVQTTPRDLARVDLSDLRGAAAVPAPVPTASAPPGDQRACASPGRK
jgi:hypothetical protein